MEGMRGGRRGLVLSLLTLFLAVACTALPPRVPVSSAEAPAAPFSAEAAGIAAAPAGTGTAEAAPTTSEAGSETANESGALETMRESYEAATAAFEVNHLMEGARHLVGLLAVDGRAAVEKEAGRRTERAELARKADATLTEIEGRLTLEPTDAWLRDGAQAAPSIRDLARGKGRSPAVRLVVNYEAGKAVVADAPIRFAFLEGAGEVTALVSTDEYGIASATVRSLTRADAPAVIRATLVIENRGLARKFGSVVRDFTYLPSRRAARIFAVERRAGSAPSRSDASAPLADAVSRGLATAGLELQPIVAESEKAARAIEAGTDEGFAAATSEAGGGWLVVAVTEYEEEGRMANRGRSFEIYTVTARTRIRILGEGALAVARPALTSVGRGGSAEAALQAALSASRAAAENDLRFAAGEIGKALD